MSLLLFTPNPPPSFAPDFARMASMSKMAARSAARSISGPPAPAPVSQSGAFALSAGEWHALGAFAATAMQMRGPVQELIPRLSALGDVAAAWDPLGAQLDNWGQARDALVTLGSDIVRYARDSAPPLYRRIAQILALLADGATDPALGAELRELRDVATREARLRADRAMQWSAAIAPFADAGRRFVDAVHGNQRNPPIPISLDEIPFLHLSVDGDTFAIAGDERNAWDGGQLWVVEQVAPEGPYAIRTADGSRTLLVDHVDGMETRVLFSGSLEELITEGPRPHLASTSDTMNWPQTLFWFTGERYIQPMQWPNHTLDCSGDDGWAQGTPVLNWRKNDGRNQKWRANPRRFWDLQFFDSCAVIASQSAGISSFQHLQGDWLAIASDLDDGITGVLQRLDTGEPFIAQLDIEATMQAWADVANEAQLAISGL